MIEFSKEELYWIERTADIESSLVLKRFFDLVSIPKENIKEEEMKLIKKFTTELIDLYTFLRTLRAKFEAER